MKTVLFDLDGVLLDTEPLYSRFWQEAAEACGCMMSYAETLALRSLDNALARARFREAYGADVYDTIRDERRRRMEQYRRTHPIRAKAGAAELLSELTEAAIPYYIVTASGPSRAARYTADAGLSIEPARVISTKNVARGKPYPAVYLEALRVAGCAPGEAVAVEDSPNGIRSAHAAGCVTVMVPDLTQPTEEDRMYLDVCCEDLAAFGTYLREI